jgi:hypothetical protein
MKVSFERTIYSSHPFLPQGPFLINHFGLPPIFGFGVKHTVVVSCCSSEVTMKLYTARTLRYHFGHILPQYVGLQSTDINVFFNKLAFLLVLSCEQWIIGDTSIFT